MELIGGQDKRRALLLCVYLSANESAKKATTVDGPQIKMNRTHSLASLIHHRYTVTVVVPVVVVVAVPL